MGLIALFLLIPSTVIAQTNYAENDTFTSIEPKDGVIGPVGSIDETLNVHTDIELFWGNNEEQIPNVEKLEFWDEHYVNAYSNVWNGQIEILFDYVHEEDMNDIREKLILCILMLT